MEKERFEELCAAYALGALDPTGEKELAEELRKGDKEQHNTLQSYLDTAQLLPLAAEQHVPSSGLKDKILKKIAKPGQSNVTPMHPVESGTSTWMRLAAIILLALLLVMAYFTFNLNQQVGELETVVEQQRLDLLDMENKLEVTYKYLDLVSARNTYMVSMDGLDPSPTGFGQLFLNEATSTALLHVSRLPATPEENDYQLWVIKDDLPISAGIFSFEDDLENHYIYIDDFVEDSLDQIAAVAITLEPKGGMPQPTGDMYLLGSPVR